MQTVWAEQWGDAADLSRNALFSREAHDAANYPSHFATAFKKVTASPAPTILRSFSI
jgi:hypothetical protein